MKKKNNNWQVVNFDYASLYPNTYHTATYHLTMLAVKLKRVKCIKELWSI